MVPSGTTIWSSIWPEEVCTGRERGSDPVLRVLAQTGTVSKEHHTAQRYCILACDECHWWISVKYQHNASLNLSAAAHARAAGPCVRTVSAFHATPHLRRAARPVCRMGSYHPVLEIPRMPLKFRDAVFPAHQGEQQEVGGCRRVNWRLYLSRRGRWY